MASYKATKPILPWRSDIVGNFWHCCQTAKGDETLLRTKWTGRVHHITNEHEWARGNCEHEPIDNPTKEYLEPGSEAHKAITELVFDERLLQNLKYYVNYRSTAELEGFQNHILMYAGKRFAYTYPVYKARCQLAALDYQIHKDRPMLLGKDGEQKYHRSYNKNSVRWMAYALREVKPYEYITEILTNIFRSRIEDTGTISRRITLIEGNPRRLSSTIAPPPTMVLVSDHKSRFPDKQQYSM